MSNVNSYPSLARPKFVAHEGSVMLKGTGMQINWAAVTAGANGIKRLHAGTLVWEDSATGLIQPADHGDSKPAMGILVSDVDDTPGQNKGMHGVYIGGHFYENLMATPPTADDKTALGARFAFSVYADSRLD